MSKEVISFKNYFKFPLQFSFGKTKVFTDDYNMAFDFTSPFIKVDNFVYLDDSTKEKVLEILNGREIGRIEKGVKFRYADGNVYIIKNNKELGIILFIRSWGRLNGTGGGLGLTEDKAMAIQDDFGKFIVDTLNK